MADAVHDAPDVLRAASPGGDGGGLRDQLFLHMRGQQFERADPHSVTLRAVLHLQQALALERRGGMRSGEHGRRQVDGDVEHVQSVEAVLHHVRVEFLRFAAVQLVEQAEARVGGGEQRAGAAGEVADLQPGQRVPVAPVRAARSAVGGQREAGQQRGGSGPRVVGGEELAVGDQPLEHDAREVVRARHAAVHQFQRGVPQRAEHGLRRLFRQRRLARGVEQRLRRGEDGMVVDRENGVPFGEQGHAVERAAGPDEGIDGLHRTARAFLARLEACLRQRLVEHERVGKHGHRHPARLPFGIVVLPEHCRQRLAVRTAQPVALRGRPGGILDAPFQRVGELVYAARGHGGALDEHREVAGGASQPARGRQAVGRRAVLSLRVEGVLQRVGRVDGLAQRRAVEGGELRRVDEGDGGLDRVLAAGGLASEAGARGGLGSGVVGMVLGLDHDGPAGRLAHKHVGPAAAEQHLPPAVAKHLPAAAQFAQRLAEGRVHDLLVGTGSHVSILPYGEH